VDTTDLSTFSFLAGPSSLGLSQAIMDVPPRWDRCGSENSGTLTPAGIPLDPSTYLAIFLGQWCLSTNFQTQFH
jgi:hypothetical protein